MQMLSSCSSASDKYVHMSHQYAPIHTDSPYMLTEALCTEIKLLCKSI